MDIGTSSDIDAAVGGAAGALPPLKPVRFHILLALAEGAGHGLSIRKVVEARTNGALRLWPATLYGTIRELAEAGLIAALDGEDAHDDDQRRRPYGMTALGQAVLQAEADRLQALVDEVRRNAAHGRA